MRRWCSYENCCCKWTLSKVRLHSTHLNDPAHISSLSPQATESFSQTDHRSEMIGWTHSRLATQSTLQSLSEMGREPRISIWNYARRYPMQSYYLLTVQLGQLGHRHPQIHCQEINTLGQSVHYNPDCIMTPKGLWQMGHKVHNYAISFPLWYVQRL